jgi:hypothetical protein
MDLTLILVVLGGLVALAVGGYLYARSRSPEGEAYHHFICPGCRRRLRYHAKQAGHKGECSNCGHQLTFPSTSEAID